MHSDARPLLFFRTLLRLPACQSLGNVHEVTFQCSFFRKLLVINDQNYLPRIQPHIHTYPLAVFCRVCVYDLGQLEMLNKRVNFVMFWPAMAVVEKEIRTLSQVFQKSSDHLAQA